MNPVSSMADVRGTKQAAGEEAVGMLFGGGFTLALFLGMAHFEKFGSTEPVSPIDEVRMVAMPLEMPPPPPKSEVPVEASDVVLPLSGLDLNASDSPVSISVVPPDLESLIPTTTSPPRARIAFGVLYADLKPKVNIDADLSHVFQTSEVDKKPYALVRVVPPTTFDVVGDASTLRVVLLVVINQNGKAESTRVMESSGNPQFDAIVASTVKDEWLFSPGIRHGKKVRVLTQQALRFVFKNSGPLNSLD